MNDRLKIMELTQIINALNIAAAEYERDAAALRNNGQPQLARQLESQARGADDLSDRLESAVDVHVFSAGVFVVSVNLQNEASRTPQQVATILSKLAMRVAEKQSLDSGEVEGPDGARVGFYKLMQE